MGSSNSLIDMQREYVDRQIGKESRMGGKSSWLCSNRLVRSFSLVNVLLDDSELRLDESNNLRNGGDLVGSAKKEG